MLPSSTVENYLKAIYLGASTLTPPQRLVPMGQLASALGVVPGTATTMVKALAESGLVEYEPYSGVALTPAGQKLAALVLRRHRLIELFLVRVMGYAWDEVHDEAEQLEHVVSDRLIDRMDEMLGRPEVDPHGDPIPDAEGQVKPQESQSLMTCPIGAPVTVTRVVDQDSAFLRFVDRHHLKPGAAIQVEERDPSADSVRVRGEGDRLITIGTRAASKLLVQVARTVALLLLAAAPALAQDAPSPKAAAAPRTNLSGYMDFHYNKPEFTDGTLDFHRFVLLVTHSFSDRIRFVSEVEIEHALVEGGEEKGELELEQAYVDFLLSRRFNVRAGMMLMPVGIINERHEPPVYYGVERPFVDTVIVPTTWFETGAGIHGELGRGWRYRAFVTAPLNAAEFSADEGIREGKQKGSQANAGRVATTGRLEYVGLRGLTVGASWWTGRSGFEFRPRFDVPVTVAEADARYSRNRFEGRLQFAQVWIDNADLLNDALTRRVGVDPNIARLLRGFYAEGGYRFIEAARFGDVGAFVRYENFDTQYRMAGGGIPLPQFDRDAWVMGATYWPDPDIAIKTDYTVVRNRSAFIQVPNSFNLGLGWWF
jgi:DtxR family transcriptional regulator, Mn-dependent transcriptional regulator